MHSSLSEGLKWLSAGSRTRAEGKAPQSMPLYEHVYLARQDATAQQVEALTAQYKGVIEQMGGKVAKTEYWGVKSLSYRIRKNRKAHMTLLNVDAPPAAQRRCPALSHRPRRRPRGRSVGDDAQSRP